jgi:ribosomal protein S18 acetylase RimI-like enzyme
MAIIIERYNNERHFTKVDQLWREVFPDDPPWNRAHNAIPAKLLIQPELFLLAVDESSKVIGSVMGGYDGHRGWVYALAVKPDHRRQGIASKLMRTLEDRLCELGCGKLNLQVRTDNTQVIALYQHLGYMVEERISMGKRLEKRQPSQA